MKENEAVNMGRKIYSRIFAPGEEIVRLGDPGENTYLIERGKVQVAVPKNDQVEVLAVMGKGEIFGEMSIIDDAPRSATVSALIETEVIVIELSHHLNSLASKNPMMNLILRLVLSRLRDANQQISGSLSVEKSKADQSLNKIRDLAVEKISFEKEMRDGLDKHEFEMHYQPIVTLETRAIAGFEALMRWKKNSEYVSPGKFIPLAEETGFIIHQGRFALQKALEDHKHFISIISELPLFMSINVSGVQLGEPQEIKILSKIIRNSGVNTSQIKLEVTESMMLDNFTQATSALGQLKNLGVSIAIDDFGTGYSSLSYLHQLPLDTLKIDQTFVANMNKTNRNRRVVESIVGLSNSLDMKIVAEGIEDEQQAEVLRKLGCHYAQGYLISPAMPFDDTLLFLRKHYSKN